MLIVTDLTEEVIEHLPARDKELEDAVFGVVRAAWALMQGGPVVPDVVASGRAILGLEDALDRLRAHPEGRELMEGE